MSPDESHERWLKDIRASASSRDELLLFDELRIVSGFRKIFFFFFSLSLLMFSILLATVLRSLRMYTVQIYTQLNSFVFKRAKYININDLKYTTLTLWESTE